MNGIFYSGFFPTPNELMKKKDIEVSPGYFNEIKSGKRKHLVIEPEFHGDATIGDIITIAEVSLLSGRRTGSTLRKRVTAIDNFNIDSPFQSRLRRAVSIEDAPPEREVTFVPVCPNCWGIRLTVQTGSESSSISCPDCSYRLNAFALDDVARHWNSQIVEAVTKAGLFPK